MPTIGQQSAEPLPSATSKAPKSEQKVPANKKGSAETAPPNQRGPVTVVVQGPIRVIQEPAANSIKQDAEKKPVPRLDDPNWVIAYASILAVICAAAAFGAGLWQAFIARGQLKAATSPRLHIEGVRLENFEIGKVPYFFIKIVNTGPVAAENIVVNMRLQYGVVADSKNVGNKWSREQTVTIPPNGNREYFVKGSELTATEYLGFTDNIPLRVTGYYQIPGCKKQDYCYKYYPSEERNRPKGVPEFIPCDFNPGQTSLVVPTGQEIKSSVRPVTVNGDPPRQDTTVTL
jgi:hypothetical protein